jgi:glycosyltransferase involved in cell wall biosynthesis
MPLVSVIIPSYNRAKLVPETIKSVLNQTFQDFEIIVVDDGSTDNTYKTVSSFPVKYIKQENQGLPNARNTGIRAAQGKYIAILDSDDCFFENSLEKRVEVMEKYPRVALVYSQILTMDENSQVTGMTYPPFKKSYLRDGRRELHDLLYVNHIPASTVMIRRSSLDQVGLFNPTFIHGQEDLEMWVRLCAAYDSAFIAEPLLKLRIHSQRMTSQLNMGQFEKNHKLIIDSVFDNPELSPLFVAERDKIYSHLYYFMAEVAYMKRDMKFLRGYIIKALKLYPQGMFSSTGLKWTSMFLITLTPQFIVNLARITKHYFHRVDQSRFQQSS